MYFTGIKVELKEYIESDSDESDTDSIKTAHVSSLLTIAYKLSFMNHKL